MDKINKNLFNPNLWSSRGGLLVPKWTMQQKPVSDPRGIRTPDSLAENQMSWAARRWGQYLNYIKVRVEYKTKS